MMLFAAVYMPRFMPRRHAMRALILPLPERATTRFDLMLPPLLRLRAAAMITTATYIIAAAADCLCFRCRPLHTPMRYAMPR